MSDWKSDEVESGTKAMVETDVDAEASVFPLDDDADTDVDDDTKDPTVDDDAAKAGADISEAIDELAEELDS